ncbi:hypothetical protein [Streptomyces nigra]|uniref:hypothetical protein n=1 Tax=Streptomyces nigra TaxID=1827580 RepID=UPI0030D24180
MSARGLLLVVALLALAAECWFQFVARDGQLVTLFAVLGIGACALRGILGAECRPNDGGEVDR